MQGIKYKERKYEMYRGPKVGGSIYQRLSDKRKKKQELCVLCASAVRLCIDN